MKVRFQEKKSTFTQSSNLYNIHKITHQSSSPLNIGFELEFPQLLEINLYVPLRISFQNQLQEEFNLILILSNNAWIKVKGFYGRKGHVEYMDMESGFLF